MNDWGNRESINLLINQSNELINKGCICFSSLGVDLGFKSFARLSCLLTLAILPFISLIVHSLTRLKEHWLQILTLKLEIDVQSQYPIFCITFVSFHPYNGMNCQNNVTKWKVMIIKWQLTIVSHKYSFWNKTNNTRSSLEEIESQFADSKVEKMK